MQQCQMSLSSDSVDCTRFQQSNMQKRDLEEGSTWHREEFT